MIGSMTITIIQPTFDRFSRRIRHLDDALLDNGRQLAGRADKPADFDAPLLSVDHVHGKQRAAVDLVVKPHVGNSVEEQFRADRRIKHSNNSNNSNGAA